MRGYTLPELLIVLGLFTVVAGIGLTAFLRGQRSATQAAFVTSVITDLREQQSRAMAGFAGELTDNSDFGIFLASDSYTLFRGSTYNASDAYNHTIELNPGLTFANVTFTNSSIVFIQGSGEVSFASGQNTFQVQDTTNGEIINFSVNRYGTPIVQ